MTTQITMSERNEWYEAVKRYTTELMRIKGVSPSADETRVAEAVLELLKEGGLEDAYTVVGLDALESDPYQRHNAYAFVRGQSARTVVLLGHIDTVGTADYGRLEPFALDPEALASRQDELAEITPGLKADLDDPVLGQDWMLGRGSVDMKSGVAANIAVMRRLAERSRQGQLPLSVVLLATVDEENESAGVLRGVQLLLDLRTRYGLEYLGAINTDYTAARYPGDPQRYAYTGTIGKLLPCFLVVGAESHVGEPFEGLDANLLAAELIADLSINDALCDAVGEQRTPPPVTLHATDLKTHYDVQLPYMAYFYLNVLTFSTTPAELLERLRQRASAALERVLGRIGQAEQRWSGTPGERPQRSATVLSYAELLALANAKQGAQPVQAALAEEWERCLHGPDGAVRDARERSLALTRRLWQLSGLVGPAVVIFYAPPYYPHLAKRAGALQDAVEAVAAAHPEERLQAAEFYPYLSDMSYLRADAVVDLAGLIANMPLWQAIDQPRRPGGYSLPLQAIHALDLPFVNLGPYGRAVHQRGERVLMSYSFGVLPQFISEIIEHLAH
ncbi:MAG TPA: M20/M25/M40 family metallo-hydrolase [Ktedonobacterales bacterium]|nr:M20/M25/M40 family metallo-hydrolase [Ktedonobacterales bacterium]